MIRRGSGRCSAEPWTTRLTSNRPLSNEDCEDGQDANRLDGSSPEVVDVGHTVEDLDDVTGDEVDAVGRLLLGDARLQGGEAGRWDRNEMCAGCSREACMQQAWEREGARMWELTMAKALRQMALVRLARMEMPTLVQPRLMR